MDSVTFTKSFWGHMIYIHETQHCTVGTSWFMWRSDRLFRPPNFTIESERIERVQHIKSAMSLLNTWFDKTTLTLMRGQGLWNQEQTSTTNNDTAPFPTLLPRIAPISCTPIVTYQTIVYIKLWCYYIIYNAVKYIIKNIITSSPPPMVTPHSKTISIPSSYRVINWKSYNLRVIQRINVFAGSFSRRYRDVITCWFTSGGPNKTCTCPSTRLWIVVN